jgi:O-antigen ligase
MDIKDAGYTIEPIKGEKVSTSNYLRFEKYELGIKTIAGNLLGVGFGRNALGKSVEGRYKSAKNLNSDSSILDMFIGTGIIGGFLWISFLLYTMWRAITAFKKHKSYFALWLVLVVVPFSSRMMIDSVGKDHLLQEFMFTVGMLVMLLREESATPYGKPVAGVKPRLLIPQRKYGEPGGTSLGRRAS